MISKKSEQWLSEAKNDLEIADILIKNTKFNASVFHSQQAAEKAIKGLLYLCNVQPWGHSVAKLLEELGKFIQEIPDDISNMARSFDRHYTTSRYPDVLPDLSPQEAYDAKIADEIFLNASKFIEFIKSKFNPLLIDIQKELEEKKDEEHEK